MAHKLTRKELKKLLLLFGIDLKKWGKGYAKTFENLYTEINKGESKLWIDGGGIYRTISAVRMVIRISGKGILVEEHQILPDGRKRAVNKIPREKMKPGEKPLAALKRGMKEELGLRPKDYFVLSEDFVQQRRQSRSYPGLPTRYTIYSFRVRIKKGVVIEDGYTVTDGDKKGKKKLVFRWARKKLKDVS